MIALIAATYTLVVVILAGYYHARESATPALGFRWVLAPNDDARGAPMFYAALWGFVAVDAVFLACRASAPAWLALGRVLAWPGGVVARRLSRTRVATLPRATARKAGS